MIESQIFFYATMLVLPWLKVRERERERESEQRNSYRRFSLLATEPEIIFIKIILFINENQKI